MAPVGCEDWEASSGLVHDLFLTSISPDIELLCDRFSEEPLFCEVIEALKNLDHLSDTRVRHRARHHALGYMIEDECISRVEAIARATEVHRQLHFGRDHIKLQLLDCICSPGLDQSIITVLANCARCKNFGSTHLHSLLEPITRRHPFELIIADYLSLPKGTNGYHTVGLYLDTYSQRIWGFKHKTHSTAKTTIAGLEPSPQDGQPQTPS
ncbi:hypothetical protein EW146_g10036 [Bondarzewia mesenterica]|uniref:Integrase zinc-binding domain-containing protein n=1 Tax=Bondarzewia mesenterica TaxID=1095465 RepID=A0A4S4L180_9AGAM|nr:hypothetical protein EW146_g10036 [Bondarzewia mesenterica]